MHLPRPGRTPAVFRLLLLVIALAADPAAVFGQAQGIPPSAGDSSSAPEQPSGSTPGMVTRSGSFSHAIPIRLPRARGPLPLLAISYDSSASNGLAGVGWSLSGFPAIARIHGDQGMKFSSSIGADTYAYLPAGFGTHPHNDNLLVAQPSTNRWFLRNNVGGSLLQFESRSSRGDGPGYWIMRDGRGTRYYFGGDAVCMIDQHCGTSFLEDPYNGNTARRGVVVWSLFKVVDAEGNYYRVTYYNDSNSLYPSHVEYNLPMAGATPRAMLVRFEYAGRTDPTSDHFREVLRTVRVYARTPSDCVLWGHCDDGVLVRKYQLTHTPSASSGRGLLTQIQEFGTDGDSAGAVGLEPTSFSYTSAARGPHTTTVSTNRFLTLPDCQPDIEAVVNNPELSALWPPDLSGCVGQTHIGDINGDGKADLVRTFAGSWRRFVEYTCGRRDGFTGPVQVLLNHIVGTDEQRPWLTTLADVNGDGRSDIVAITLQHRTGVIWTEVALGRPDCTFGSLNGTGSYDWDVFESDTRPSGGWMSPMIYRAWRLLAADLNGDGLDDVVLYDDGAGNTAGPAQRVLYYKVSTGQVTTHQINRLTYGQVFQPLAFYRADQPAQWIAASGSFTPGRAHSFNGILATDLNGDGRSDIVASWSSRPPSSTDADAYPSQITQMIALGTSSGLDTPKEYSTVGHAWNAGGPTWDYLAMREGDFNGDGLRDVLFAFQGATGLLTYDGSSPADYGQVYGRDLRARLGSTGEVPVLNLWAQSQSSYPAGTLLYYWRKAGHGVVLDDGHRLDAYRRELHQNPWDFFTADINGDGLDDVLQFYRGADGEQIHYGLSGPAGLETVSLTAFPDNIASAAAGSTDCPLDTRPFSDGKCRDYTRFVAATGDVNGDGMADLVIFRIGEGAISRVDLLLGSPDGLRASGTLANAQTEMPQDRATIAYSLRRADVNGDGRDDFVFVNDHVDQPGSGQIITLLSEPGADGGFPDRLNRIDNGRGGVVNVSYRLASDFQNAVRTDGVVECGGASGPVVAPSCGVSFARPRALVQSIVRDDGEGLVVGETYDYSNGRTRIGRPTERLDLGFESITKTRIQDKAIRVTSYRQDVPFQGLVRRVTSSRANGALLSRRDYEYAALNPAPGVNGVRMATVTDTSYEAASVPVTTRRTSYSWNPADLTLTEERDSTIESSAPDDPVGNDSDVVTRHYYAANDTDNWIVGKWRGSTRLRARRGTPTAGWSLAILGGTRMTYDESQPDPHRRLRRTLVEELLLDSSTQACGNSGDPAFLCSGEIAAGVGRWVTTFRNPRFDATGNITYQEGVYTVTPAEDPLTSFGPITNRHAITRTFDPYYQGLIQTSSDAQGHITRFEYNAAAQLIVFTDPNGQTTTTVYDVYQRRSALQRPGTAAPNTVTWTYAGMVNDPHCRRRCYGVTETSYAGTEYARRVDQYFAGFGNLRKRAERFVAPDTSSLFDGFVTGGGAPLAAALGGLRAAQDESIIVLYSTAFDSVTHERINRVTEPFFASAPASSVKYIETRFDERGRVTRERRVSSTFRTDKTFAAYAYNTDQSTTSRDALSRPTTVYRNARGLPTRVTDALGHDTVFQYNVALRPQRVELPAGQTGNTIDWTYDSWGRVLTENDPARGYAVLVYDDAGNVIVMSRYPSATSTSFTSRVSRVYDGVDRLLREAVPYWPVPVGGPPMRTMVRYTYDDAAQANGIGRLTSVADPSGTTRFNYDARGNIARREVTLDGLDGSYAFDLTYDDQDRLVVQALPAAPGQTNGAVQEYLYSADGVLIDLVHNHQRYAHHGGFNTLKQPRDVSVYETWDGGSVSGRAWLNWTSYAYDADHRVARIQTRRRTPALLGTRFEGTASVQNDTLMYDAAGNTMSVTDNRPTKSYTYTPPSGTNPISVDTDATWTYAVDTLDRMTRATRAGTTTANYHYDPLGNLIGNGGSIISYGTCSGLGLSAPGSGAETLSCITSTRPWRPQAVGLSEWTAYHDSEGKRTRFSSAMVTYYYRYDYRQRLTSIIRNGVVKEQFSYDFAGNRAIHTTRHADGSTTTRFRLGAALELQRHSSNPSRTAVSWYIGDIAILTGGDRLPGQSTAAQATGNQNRRLAGTTDAGNAQGTYSMHRDRLGSTVAATSTDAISTETTRNSYDPWGQIDRRRSLGFATTPVRYTNAPQDDDAGLVYLGARYYDPTTRRFLTPDDRITGGGLDAQGYNRFAYAFNNPLKFVDPTGHEPDDAGGLANFFWDVMNAPPRHLTLFPEGIENYKFFSDEEGLSITSSRNELELYYADKLLGLSDTRVDPLTMREVIFVWQAQLAIVGAPFLAQAAWAAPMATALTLGGSAVGGTAGGLFAEAMGVPRDSWGFQFSIDVGSVLGGEAASLGYAYVSRHAALAADARVARGELVDRLLPSRSKPAVVSAGYNFETGEIAARSSGRGGLTGPCGEDFIVDALGGNRAAVSFVESVRVRGVFTPVPVCAICEAAYGRRAFVRGTTFQSDGPKD